MILQRHYTKNTKSLENDDKKQTPGTEAKGDAFLRVLEFPKAQRESAIAPKEGRKADDWNDILNRWYQQYQDFVGITDLKKAQDRVTELSEGLLAAQGERRRLQGEIEEVQAMLVQNHQHITKTEQYSQEHMRLFSQARELNDRLREVRSQFTGYEQTERDTFTQLSAAIRDCHERERMQAEQGKYWSIIASVVSAALASVITSVNNWVRIREIKDHVTTSQQSLQEGYQQMHHDIVTSLASLGPQGLTTASKDTQGTGEGGQGGTVPGGVSVAGEFKGVDCDVSVATSAGKIEELTGSFETVAERMSQTADELTEVAKDAAKISQVAEKLSRLSEEFIAAVEANKNIGEISRQAVENIAKASESLVNQLSAVLGAREGVVPLPVNTVVGGSSSGGGDVSYPRVAATMLVGAALGTLVTAFFLGALGGSGG